MSRSWVVAGVVAVGLVAQGCAADSSRVHLGQRLRPPGLSLLDRYPLPGDRLFPESVAFDAKREAFFVSSLEHGTITRIGADGTALRFFAGTGEKGRLTLGLKVDPPRDRLIVCSLLRQKPPTGRIWIFDLASGQRTHDIDLTRAAPNGSCNDVAIHPSGDVFVTDRELPNIYRIRTLAGEGAAELVLFAQHRLLGRPPVGIGQNGAAITPDGKTLLTTQYFPPRLWRVPIDRPTEVTRVDLHGLPRFSELLGGADGMVFLGDGLYVAFGTSLVRLRSADAQWHRAAATRLQVGTKLAAVTVAQGQLYVLKSDVAKYVLGGTPSLPFEILRVDPAQFDPR